MKLYLIDAGQCLKISPSSSNRNALELTFPFEKQLASKLIQKYKLMSLRTVSIVDCNLSPTEMKQLLELVTSLDIRQSVIVNNCNLQDAHLEYVKKLIESKSIFNFDFRNNAFSLDALIEMIRFYYSARNPSSQVRSLKLQGNTQLGIAEKIAFNIIAKQWTSHKEFVLIDAPSQDSNLNKKDFDLLHRILNKNIGYISNFSFQGLPLDFDQIVGILSILKGGQIKSLDFSSCDLKDEDAVVISKELTKLIPSIKSLSFHDNYIADEGATKIVQALLNYPNLEKIDFRDNDIGFTGCEKIPKILKSNHVTVLLSGNYDDLTEDSNLDFIHKSRHYYQVNEERFDTLLKQFPALQRGDLFYGLTSNRKGEAGGRSKALEAVSFREKSDNQYQFLIIDEINLRSPKYHPRRIDTKNFDDFCTLIELDLNKPGFRGKCKSGILWSYQNDKKVHFILDDLDMREFSKKDRRSEDRSCTESEVKFIFKYYDHLKSTVVFWRTNPKNKQLERVLPPWEDAKTKKYWKAYVERQQYKKKQISKMFPNPARDKNLFFSTYSKRKHVYYSQIVARALLILKDHGIVAAKQKLIDDTFERLCKADDKDQVSSIVLNLIIANKGIQSGDALDSFLKSHVKQKKDSCQIDFAKIAQFVDKQVPVASKTMSSSF